MKHTWRYKLCVLGMALLFAIPQLKAQDVMVVDWEVPGSPGEPQKNALWNAIMGDTVAGGARANLNRVYQLKKGGYYWITERIVNDGWPLRIVGEPAGTTAMENPPVIQMVTRENGTVDGRMITGQGDLELRNLWLTGRDDNGVQTYYQPIQFDGSGYTIIVDNCILEQTNFALIAVTGSNNKIYYTNNKYRNLVGKPSTQQWEGRGISIWADQDTVIVENNTFFNIQMTVLQIEGGSAKYVRFNHNTIVNLGRVLMSDGNWTREGYFANNLIVNGYWHGEGYNDYSAISRDPRAYYGGMWAINPMPTKYGIEESRRILFANTAAWRDPYFATKYADTIRAQYFIGPVTKEDFLDKLNDNGEKAYPQMRAIDTLWLTERPNFQTYPGVEDGYPLTMLDSMWSNISMLRQGITPATDYHYKPTEYPTQVSWPLPENFAYTTPANLLTAGTDGLPLGDLNWFPDKKAQFETNKATYIQQLQDKAGPKVVVTPVGDYECEEGTLSGTATELPFSGFTYFQMDGGGFIQWNFNLETAGQYDLNVWTHLRGNSTRGQRIIVNGVSIHDPMNWGEYIWSPTEHSENIWYGIPNNEWVWTRIKQEEIKEAGALTLPAGHNTIRIESSWGYQNFAGIDVIPSGGETPVVELRAPDATFDIVSLKSEGAPWVPSKFKSVALGSNGSVELQVDVTDAGDYLIALFYQNCSETAKTIQIQIDGGAAINMTLPGSADSTGLSKTSDVFALTPGSHTIKLSGADVNLDYIKLNQQTIIDAVDANTPSSFALEQNYPNPFNPSTKINFTLGKPANVKLVVYNILGQKVATLIDTRMDVGPHTYEFNASKLASGVYFYKLEAGDFRSVKKMLLLK